ncbi:VanZ family protein [Streptomyces carminius]|uniref:VanZ family protein n=1 Tax=Streptomyces carminius TaxID=2665496 RepID=A0A2M8LS41_9ACTN|nr:VanZ family protein [Streptomyces carminius]PJE94757.1 VanZ family protein [Streptomyces carminius]
MIEAVFQDHLGFLALAIAATLAAGALGYAVAARRTGRVQAVFYGLWASSTVGPVLLTGWSGGGTEALTRRCTVNPAVTDVFTGPQGQLNVLLFVPFGLFAVLATRRPLPGIAAGLLFIATVETAQATVPFVSRLCDTDDMVTNAVGVLAGAAVGALVLRRFSYGTPLARTVVRRAAATGAALSLLVAVTWAVVIDPVRAVLPTLEHPASGRQVRALDTALGEAFGDAYPVGEAELHDNVDGPDTVTATLPGGGLAELTWPDREKLTVRLPSTVEGEEPRAHRVPGADRPVGTAREARQVATRFARDYAPWALRDSEVTVRPVGAVGADDPGLGWEVEWRRWKDGVLMPMRLDVRIEPSGRLTGLTARHVADPELPPATVGADAAWRELEAHHGLEPGQGTREEPVLLAERWGEEWRVHWRVAVRDGEVLRSATVDATTGELRDAAESPADDPPPDL